MPSSESGSLSNLSETSRTLLDPVVLPSLVPDSTAFPAHPPSYLDHHSRQSNGSFPPSHSSYTGSSASEETSPPSQHSSQSRYVVHWPYPVLPVDRSYLRNLGMLGAPGGPYAEIMFASSTGRTKEKHSWPGDWSLLERDPPKYLPELHPILAIGTRISYDVRKRPRDGIITNMYEHFRGYAATSEPVQKLRIQSSEFPRVIDVDVEDDDGYESRRRGGACVHVIDVWKALYGALQERVTDDELAMLEQIEWNLRVSKDDSLQARMNRAKSRRERKGNRSDKIRRIDWLGRRTKFLGLLREKQTVDQVNFAGRRRNASGVQDNVWCARFGSSE